MFRYPVAKAKHFRSEDFQQSIAKLFAKAALIAKYYTILCLIRIENSIMNYSWETNH